eukprot:COSAG01_NODE_187_length_22645_cov_44.301565_14_plen_200_part_00
MYNHRARRVAISRQEVPFIFEETKHAMIGSCKTPKPTRSTHYFMTLGILETTMQEFQFETDKYAINDSMDHDGDDDDNDGDGDNGAADLVSTERLAEHHRCWIEHAGDAQEALQKMFDQLQSNLLIGVYSTSMAVAFVNTEAVELVLIAKAGSDEGHAQAVLDYAVEQSFRVATQITGAQVRGSVCKHVRSRDFVWQGK